jgi:hypothetical protein
MTQIPNNSELGSSITVLLKELGLLMSTMTRSNTTPLLTLIRHAITLTPNHNHQKLTRTKTPANITTEFRKNVVFSILDISLLQNCAAHVMEERL